MRSFVDMEMDDDEAKRADPFAAAAGAPRPKYPYGLCITLSQEELKKLGLEDDLPEVGNMLHGTFMADVTSVSESEQKMPDGSTKRCCRVELQITHLACEDEDRERPSNEARAKSRYGNDDEEDSE